MQSINVIAIGSSQRAESKGRPLTGTKKDLNLVSKFFWNVTVQVIESSQHNTLLSMHYIKHQLALHFKKNGINVFYYTGHGHRNGDLAIDTLEHKTGDQLTLVELLWIWRTHKKEEDAKLVIILDSCYSGSWCEEAKKLETELQKNLEIITSSRPNQSSLDTNQGSLFTRVFFSQCSYQEFQELKKLQQPYAFIQNEQKDLSFQEMIQRRERLNSDQILVQPKINCLSWLFSLF